MLEFYDNHDVCAPIDGPTINLGAKPDKVSSSSEEELDTLLGFEGYLRFLNAQNNRVGEDINPYTSDSEGNEMGEEGSNINLDDDSNVSEETKKVVNNVEIPLEISHLVKFNVDD